MIKNYQSIIGTRIVRQQDRFLVGLIKDIIINPDTGKVEGFWLKSITNPLGDKVLQTQDILEWKNNIYIHDEHIISDPNDLLRIVDVLERETFVVENHVIGESDISYGSVYDLDFETDIYQINNIYCHKTIFGLFSHARSVFSYKNIVEILPEKILVKDDSTEKEIIIEPGLLEDQSPAI